jgi:hypothetical protein
LGNSFKRGHYLTDELNKAGFQNVPPSLVSELHNFAHRLVNAPTQYFEAKPQRLVRLNEFRGAVVPIGANPRTIEILKQHGLPISYYKNGQSEEAEGQNRHDAINAMADSQDLKLSEGDLNLEPLVK